jgi:Ca2+-transporting ATPase
VSRPAGPSSHAQAVSDPAASGQSATGGESRDGGSGLTTAEAAARLAAEGPNALTARRPPGRLPVLARQFRGLVVWVLVAAAAVSAAIGDWVEAAAIGAIVALNGLVGFLQEWRAESALEALRRMTTPRARVMRDGRSVVIPAEAVVRGDLLLVEAGDLVAADARLVDAASLEANEAILTGESMPVAKGPVPHELEAGPASVPLGERRHLVFAGTSITRGQGRAVVVATAMATELGRIASLLETAGREETPLQRRLDRLSKRLLVLAGAVVALVFLLRLARGEPLVGMLLAALSLAVAAIPEGLPTVVTLALAVGVQRMARRHALVRRMPAVETLGAAQVICSDKTGTLTTGELTARRLWTPQRTDAARHRLLYAAAACNEAEIGSQGRVIGDPTEGALLLAAARAGIHRSEIERRAPRVFVLPFDSERKRMTIARVTDGGTTAYLKGAPDVVLDLCTRVAGAGGDTPLRATFRREALETVRTFADQALRVLAVAERRLPRGLDARAPQAVERDLTFLGLVGLADAPRAEAREAVARCRAAGIRVVMITGDHPGTGAAIARELGILAGGDAVLAGPDVDRMDEAALTAAIPRTAVYARVAPAHKLRIVRAFKRAGLVVAMTGDGVNDAPAVREASVGIAMGRTGTEVTKEAADIVVTDDNFASIVNAVEEGRRVFDNIQKTLLYLLAGNTGEILAMLLAALAGWPIPLLPVHILWVNFVTDGLPALALAAEPADPEVLRRPPRPPEQQFADRPFVRRLALAGGLIGLVSLLGFWLGYRAASDVVAGQSFAFAVLVVSHVMWAFGARSQTRTFWQLGSLTNRWLLAVVAVTLALQVAIESVPWLAHIFGVQPLGWRDWLVAIGLGLVPVTGVELAKLASHRAQRQAQFQIW